MSEQIDLFKVTEVELVYITDRRECERPVVTNPDSAHQLLRENWRQGTLELVESFYVMFLDNSKGVKGLAEISRGGSNATIVEPKMIFAYAIKVAANSILLAHNHPSGNPKPSSADVSLTKRLIEAGNMLGIPVNDHLILTPSSYTSMRNLGFF
jgi:DNA repair protein RadC